jgi:hypothetical protein
MRRYSLIAAAILSLAMASSVFAATPSAAPAAATSTPAAHHWTATFSATGLSGRARLFAAPGWRFGWLAVNERGLARGAKVEVTIVDQTTSTTLYTTWRTVRAHGGRHAFLAHLDAKVTAALKASIAAKDTIVITVTSGAKTATGTFKPARG